MGVVQSCTNGHLDNIDDVVSQWRDVGELLCFYGKVLIECGT